MSKTNWVDGSPFPATFVNTIYGTGTGGGHEHDNVDADGHAQFINLQSMVTGYLPPTHYSPPVDFISGFQMTWSNSGSAYSIVIGPGAARDDSFGFPMLNSNSLSKLVIAAPGTAVVPWAAGSNAGGVAAGATLPAAGHSGWLHAFAICNGSTNTTTDYGFDSSTTAANLKIASGYNRARRIGSIYLSNSGGTYAIYRFLQAGDRFTWQSATMNPLNPLHTAAGGAGIATIAVPVYATPPSFVCTAILQVISAAAVGETIMTNWHTLSSGATPTTAYADMDTWAANTTTQAVRIEVDTTGGAYLSQFVYMTYSITGSNASTYVSYNPWGYIDRRGKDNQ